jgi:hypothetical protein
VIKETGIRNGPLFVLLMQEPDRMYNELMCSIL